MCVSDVWCGYGHHDWWWLYQTMIPTIISRNQIGFFNENGCARSTTMQFGNVYTGCLLVLSSVMISLSEQESNLMVTQLEELLFQNYDNK